MWHLQLLLSSELTLHEERRGVSLGVECSEEESPFKRCVAGRCLGRVLGLTRAPIASFLRGFRIYRSQRPRLEEEQ